MHLTKEQQILIITTYSEIKNVRATVEQFQTTFDGRVVSETTVRKTVTKFKEIGTIHNRNKEHSGHHLAYRSPSATV